MSVTPGATQRTDAHKGTLAVGTGKQLPHLGQFAVTNRPEWAEVSQRVGLDVTYNFYTTITATWEAAEERKERDDIDTLYI